MHPTQSARRRRGANAIEFALTLPLFLTIIVGLMEYGYVYATIAGIDNSTTLACRQGAMTDPDLQNPVTIAEADFGTRSGLFCQGDCSFDATDLLAGDYVVPNRTLRCEATKPMTQLTGMLPNALYPASIRSVSYYRLEWQRKP